MYMSLYKCLEYACTQCIHTTTPCDMYICDDSVYMEAVKDHVITNVAGGKTVCLKKSNFPNTGKGSAFPSIQSPLS